MNPYPFVGLNHFTVPVAISVSKADQHNIGRARARQGSRSISLAAAPTGWIVAYATVRKVWRLSSGVTLIVVAVA
jgi:hypothetical protein